jgi:hypothetical protein
MSLFDPEQAQVAEGPAQPEQEPGAVPLAPVTRACLPQESGRLVALVRFAGGLAR